MPQRGASELAPNSFLNAVNSAAVLVPGPKWVWCGDRGKQANTWVRNSDIPVWVSGIDGHVIVHFEQIKKRQFYHRPLAANAKSSNYGVMILEK